MVVFVASYSSSSLATYHHYYYTFLVIFIRGKGGGGRIRVSTRPRANVTSFKSHYWNNPRKSVNSLPCHSLSLSLSLSYVCFVLCCCKITRNEEKFPKSIFTIRRFKRTKEKRRRRRRWVSMSCGGRRRSDRRRSKIHLSILLFLNTKSSSSSSSSYNNMREACTSFWAV